MPHEGKISKKDYGVLLEWCGQDSLLTRYDGLIWFVVRGWYTPDCFFFSSLMNSGSVPRTVSYFRDGYFVIAFLDGVLCEL